VEAARVATMLVVETSALEATAAENQATLVEREALKRASRVEVEKATTLASTHEDVEGFTRKINHLEDDLTAEHQAQEVSEREHREQFEELTLLQTRGSELCHSIVGPP
jgi:hypothetical protein